VPILALQEPGRSRELVSAAARRDDEHADKEARHANGPEDDERAGEGPESRVLGRVALDRQVGDEERLRRVGVVRERLARERREDARAHRWHECEQAREHIWQHVPPARAPVGAAACRARAHGHAKNGERNKAVER
jgi:hypothetical protein